MSEEKKRADVVHIQVDMSGLVFQVVINRGREHGVKDGEVYLVYGLGPSIKDPSSGEDLGVLEEVRGRGKVVHVQDKMSTVRSIEKAAAPAKKVIKKSMGGVQVFPSTYPPIVEETEIPQTAELPFEGVRVGDRAKLI